MCYPNFSYVINRHDELVMVNDGLCGHSEIEVPVGAHILDYDSLSSPRHLSRWRGEYDWVNRQHIIEDRDMFNGRNQIPRYSLASPPPTVSNTALERIQRAEHDRFSDPEKFIRWLDQNKEGMPLIVWDSLSRTVGHGVPALYRLSELCTREGQYLLSDRFGDAGGARLFEGEASSLRWDVFKHLFLASDKNRVEAWRN